MKRSITKTKGKMIITDWQSTPANWHSGGYEYDVEYDVDVYHASADTYSELITAIDGIAAENLKWHSKSGSLGIEGMPHKSEGRWKAVLRGLAKGEGRKI